MKLGRTHIQKQMVEGDESLPDIVTLIQQIITVCHFASRAEVTAFNNIWRDYKLPRLTVGLR